MPQNDTADRAARSGPCSGYRVLELGTMVSGPFCGQLLADMGADVIKLEGKDGDLMRAVHPIKHGQSAQFLQFNRNKRSIAVDLKSPEGQHVARALVARADILVENFRPGVTSRMGLDYETVRAINPRLVYVSISGFGPDGPYAKLPAYDQVIQALTGFMPIQGSAERPEAIRSVMVDKVSGMSAALAAVAALLERGRTGAGQHVELNMLDAYSAVLLPELLAAHSFVGDPPGALPPPAIYRPLATLDGHLLGLIVQPHQFAAICRALDLEHLVGDPRFATAPQRFAAMDQLLDALEEKTRLKTTAELLDILWADGNVAIAPVNSVERFLADPQVVHNRTVLVGDHPTLGAVRTLAPFVRFANHDTDDFSPAPQLGEHGREILAELGIAAA